MEIKKLRKVYKDLSGKRFGRLVVISPTDERAHSQVIYKCKCDCGKFHKVYAGALVQGNTKSCGCLAVEKRKTAPLRHGYARTPEYSAWLGMRQRCSNNNGNKSKSDYYDRGIRVCDEWDCKNGFIAFLSHVGKRPSKAHSLDRIDVNGNYEPGNVQWATREQQMSNRRDFKSLSNFTTKELLDELHRRGIIPE